MGKHVRLQIYLPQIIPQWESKCFTALPSISCFYSYWSQTFIHFKNPPLAQPHNWSMTDHLLSFCQWFCLHTVTFHGTKEQRALCSPADALHEMHLRWQFSSRCLCVSLEVQERTFMVTALAAHHQLWSWEHCLIDQVEGSIRAVLLVSLCYQETVNFSF